MRDQDLFNELDQSKPIMALDCLLRFYAQAKAIVGILMIVCANRDISSNLISDGIAKWITGRGFDFDQVRIRHAAGAVGDIQYPAKIPVSRLTDNLQIGEGLYCCR